MTLTAFRFHVIIQRREALAGMSFGKSRGTKPNAPSRNRTIFISLLMFLLTHSLSGACKADDVDLQSLKKQLIQTYERAAFPVAGQSLIKTASSPRTTINIVCKTGPCSDMVATVSRILPNDRFSVTANELGFSPNDNVSLVILDGPKTDIANLSKNGEFGLLRGEQVFDQGDSECHGVQFRVDNLVTRIILSIDDRLPEKTSSFCILYQLMANSGLTLQSDYQTMKSQINDLEMADNFKGMSRLIALHFWQGSSPGMTRQDFESHAFVIPLKILIGE